MRSGIVYYILLLLDVNDSVDVPHVGRLKKRVYPAKTDLEVGEVHPPQSTIQFSVLSGKSDDLLQKYIAHAAGIGEADAALQLEAFGREFSNELEVNGRAAIDYLGVFYKRGDDVLFTPDNRTSGLGHTGLRKVDLPKTTAAGAMTEDASVTAVAAAAAMSVATTVERTEAKEEEKQPAEHPGTETKVSRFKPMDSTVVWLAGVFGIIFILVTVLAVVNYTSRQNEKYPSSAFNRAPMPEPMIAPTSDDTMPDTNSSEPLPGEETVMKPEPVVGPIVSDGGLAQEIQSDLLDYEVPAETSDDMDTADATTSSAGETDDTSAATVSLETTPVTPEKAVVECHVVVGAFGVHTNVERMMERLTALGYKVDTMSKGSLTQVGVPAPCGSSEIDRLLSELRSEIESQAWILKK